MAFLPENFPSMSILIGIPDVGLLKASHRLRTKMSTVLARLAPHASHGAHLVWWSTWSSRSRGPLDFGTVRHEYATKY